MLSSISSSETDAAAVRADTAAPADNPETANPYRFWCVCALLSLSVFCVSIEVLTRFGFTHISRIEARISKDHRDALAITKTDRPTVLIIGNSLMLAGIDYQRLRNSLAGQAHIVGFPIEQTQYDDWYFGLRRLFGEGSRPDMIVLSMSVGHLIASGIRGDYSAYYLFRLADIPEIRRDLNCNLTETSSLVLSRFSLFYAGRSPLRSFVLGRAAPAYAGMLQVMAFKADKAQSTPDQEIERIAEARLTELRQLASLNHARFGFLLAPGFGPGEASLVTAGARSHTDVMIPIHLNELGQDKFSDGFHLNASGAQIFTDKFAALLETRLTAR